MTMVEPRQQPMACFLTEYYVTWWTEVQWIAVQCVEAFFGNVDSKVAYNTNAFVHNAYQYSANIKTSTVILT